MIIFISGRPGCGKSTFVGELIRELKTKKKIAGIITPEIRNRKREGFEIIDLASEKKEILASVKQREGPKVGKYRVNIEGIKNIVKEFEKSTKNADIIFIDEIGKMELFCKEFKIMLEKIFESKKQVIATLHRAYIEEYKNKGKIIWLEKGKLQEAKEKILEELELLF